MPTRRGWGFTLLGIATLAIGRAFGIIELFVIGIGLVGLVVASWIYVRLVELKLEIGRDVTPLRVHAGTAARVELRVTNLGRARSPLLELSDPVVGTKGAHLLVAPLRRRASARAAYRLPTSRRGLIGIGPLTVRVQDPFGLAAIRAIAASRLELTVFPHVDELTARPAAGNRDPHAGAEHPQHVGLQGEDFYALRTYVVGDDLRRVHWPSTARNDELMVRQDELPWQGRTTILLDTRSSCHDDESFEVAVSATASLLSSAHARRDAVRLITTDGTDSAAGSAQAHLDAAMEYLAVIEPSRIGSMAALLAALGRATGGSLVVIFGRTTSAELEALGRAAKRRGSCTVIITDPGPVTIPPVLRRVVHLTSGQTFRDAWDGGAHGRGSHRAPARPVVPA